MKMYITLDPDNYLRLSLIVPAIALLGSTRRSTADPLVRHNTAAYTEVAPPAYNSESRVLTDHGRTGVSSRLASGNGHGIHGSISLCLAPAPFLRRTGDSI
jgi:hypothetical protein